MSTSQRRVLYDLVIVKSLDIESLVRINGLGHIIWLHQMSSAPCSSNPLISSPLTLTEQRNDLSHNKQRWMQEQGRDQARAPGILELSIPKSCGEIESAGSAEDMFVEKASERQEKEAGC